MTARTNRPLVVGEDFGHSPVEYHNDSYALTGASGRRLASLCGFKGPNAILSFLLAFERTNVVEHPEDWRDKQLVVERVADILVVHPERRIVLLGAKVAEAFQVADRPLFDWVTAKAESTTEDGSPPVSFEFELAKSPHPSGRNFWWNDPSNVAEATRFWTGLAAE